MRTPTTSETPLNPDTILEHYGERIYRIARGMSNSDADAEDVLQNTLLKILRHARTFRGDSEAMGWIYRITMNEARNIHRRRTSRPATSLDERTYGNTHDGRTTRRIDDPSSTTIRGEVEASVRAAVHELPAVYREPVVLHDLGGLPYRAAAAAMDLSLAAFKSRLHRARLLLRESLAPTPELALAS